MAQNKTPADKKFTCEQIYYPDFGENYQYTAVIY